MQDASGEQIEYVLRCTMRSKSQWYVEYLGRMSGGFPNITISFKYIRVLLYRDDNFAREERYDRSAALRSQ